MTEVSHPTSFRFTAIAPIKNATVFAGEAADAEAAGEVLLVVADVMEGGDRDLDALAAFNGDFKDRTLEALTALFRVRTGHGGRGISCGCELRAVKCGRTGEFGGGFGVVREVGVML